MPAFRAFSNDSSNGFIASMTLSCAEQGSLSSLKSSLSMPTPFVVSPTCVCASMKPG